MLHGFVIQAGMENGGTLIVSNTDCGEILERILRL